VKAGEKERKNAAFTNSREGGTSVEESGDKIQEKVILKSITELM